MQLLASEEYGLRCLLRLAGVAGVAGAASDDAAAPVPISRIAAAEGLSPEYTAKLMRRLRLARLVESVRGAEGGYRLARPAGAISVWSAIEALGGEFFPEGFCECHPGRPRECVRSADCSLRALWRAIQRGLRETLERVSLEDLRRDEPGMARWLEADPALASGPALGAGSPAGRRTRTMEGPGGVS